MKLKTIERIKGELNLPLIYFMVTGTCLLFVYVLYLVKQIPRIPCVFKTITGLPCPTCGATRVLKCLFQFDIVSAFLWNPMLFLAGIAFIAWVVYGFYMSFSGKKAKIILTGKEKRFLRWGVVILILIDWIYLAIAGI
ncbi:MAG TPA: DUF2752 domain-containing protein [Candidatus Deferrimicrobium sp.]|nr:DUF2752 domain-containing protein [Candidatus Deferrimicrobium sp.]